MVIARLFKFCASLSNLDQFFIQGDHKFGKSFKYFSLEVNVHFVTVFCYSHNSVSNV